MVDRAARREFSQLLRKLAAGICTTDCFDDRACEFQCATRDLAFQEVIEACRGLYSDIWPYKLVGRNRLSVDQRAAVARIVLWLRSDSESASFHEIEHECSEPIAVSIVAGWFVLRVLFAASVAPLLALLAAWQAGSWMHRQALSAIKSRAETKARLQQRLAKSISPFSNLSDYQRALASPMLGG